MLCQEDTYLRRKNLNIRAIHFDSKREGWWVVASEQLLYPEGGGQPADRGTVGGFEVLDVQKTKSDLEGVRILLKAGVEDQVTLNGAHDVVLDWKHRFDMMQQHSGQHLLTAVFLKELGYLTVRFHISKESCAIDLETQELTDVQCQNIEEQVNDLILQDIPYRSFSLERQDFEKGRENLTIRSRGLPDDTIERVRMVEILGVDSNNCGGTHVHSTAQLQLCKILKSERVNKRVRVHFLFGLRAIAWMKKRLDQENALTELLCQGPANHPKLVAQLQKTRKEQSNVISALEDLWLTERIERIRSINQTACFYHTLLTMKGMQYLARELRKKHPSSHIVLANETQFLIECSSTEKINAHRNDIMSILRGKGGGRPPRIQGKADLISAEQVASIVELLGSVEL
ncbi:MAG: hypothetical protein CMK59_09090 [Proteobacteria bacterium]|nr:hypothetical protein [Pseudomonadota bacterium]